MKRAFIGLVLFGIGFFAVAQSIDRTQYADSTLFDVELWERQGQETVAKKFKTTVEFRMQSGTSLMFADLDGDTTEMFEVTKRWPSMQRGQKVTIYFTAKKSYGSGDTPMLDDIDYDNISPVINSGQNSTSQQSTINRSQYSETTLFDVELWERQGQAAASQKFKATVEFRMQSGTSLMFADLDGDTTEMFEVTKRWPSMRRGQKVTIYFTARKSYGSGDTPTLDDIQY
jgi:NMD protein affecting ribosome stability and mRNA decay